MNIGVCVIHSRNRDVDADFRKARELGLAHCQLVSWDKTLWTKDEAEKVRAAAKKYGMEITAFWCGWEGPKAWNLTDGPDILGLVPEPYRAMRMRNLCDGSDFAKLLGVTDLVTHVGFLPEAPHDPVYLSLVPALRFVAEHCKSNGQNFLFETGQETPVTLLRTITDIGTGNLYINLDPANLILYGKANPVDALDVFGSYVRGVHAKDGLYPVNGRELGEETALGEGKADFPKLIAKLKALGYQGCLTIEREIEGEEQIRDIIRAKELLQDLLDLPAGKKDAAS